MRAKASVLVLSLAACALGWAWVFATEPLPKSPPIPADNPQTVAKVELGKILFFDPRLSKTGTISCNSCHNVMAGGDDGRPNSIGVTGKAGERSAPTVWNAAFLSVQFWDGRAPTLEEQAKGPLVNPIEMGMESHDVVVARVAAIPEYHRLFHAAFPGEAEPLAIGNVAKAIAAYERTLIAGDSPFDRFAAGDSSALTPGARRGYETALEMGCLTCHSGPNFAGPTMEAGQGFFMKFPGLPGSAYDERYALTQDPGRYGVTKDEGDRSLWRVPTLRNVALTAPYFHNGCVPTLDEAVRVMAKTQQGQDLTPQQADDLTQFLIALTGTFPAQTMPRLPVAPGRSNVPAQ